MQIDQVLLEQRVRCILETLDERRTASEPWPPSAERVAEHIRWLDADIAQQNREFGVL